jgi:hypothetical protein
MATWSHPSVEPTQPQITVVPGAHKVQVKMDWVESEPLEISVTGDETVGRSKHIVQSSSRVLSPKFRGTCERVTAPAETVLVLSPIVFRPVPADLPVRWIAADRDGVLRMPRAAGGRTIEP